MNLPSHYLVLYLIAGVAFTFWLCGLWFLINTRRRTVAAAGMWDEQDERTASNGDVSVRGWAEVAGRPEELSAKAAAHFAQYGLGRLGPVRILEQSDDRLLFESQGGLGARFFRRGVFEFEAVGQDRTRIDYTVQVPRRSGLLATAWIIQMVGLVVLVGLFLALHFFVAPHADPAVHWQSAQMGQVVHFLWPPFLFAGIYRRVQTHMRNTLDTFVNNLPYLKV